MDAQRGNSEDELDTLLQEYREGNKQFPAQKLQKHISEVSSADRYNILARANEEKRTALHIAADRGDTDIVKCILGVFTDEEKFKLLMLQDCNGKTALAFAAQNGHTEIVLYTLTPMESDRRYEMLNVLCVDGRSTVHRAAYTGHLDALKDINSLVTKEQMYSLLVLQDSFGYIPVTFAALNGHTETVQYILNSVDSDKRYAMLNVQNEKGSSTLHIAALNGHTGAAKAIIDSVTTVQLHNLLMLRDSDGDTAIACAAVNGHTETVTCMLNSVDSDKRYEILNVQNKIEQSPLHRAAWNGHADVLRAIMDSVTDQQMTFLLLLRDFGGSSAATNAAWQGHMDVVQYLLNAVERHRRYEILRPNLVGVSTVHFAAQNGDPATFEAILDSVTDDQKNTLLSDQSLFGTTALAHGIYGGHSETVTYILNAVDSVKRLELLKVKAIGGSPASSPLHIAAENGQTNSRRAVFDSVSEKQRDQIVMLQDGDGNTALILAALKEHLETAQYIVNNVDSDTRYKMLRIQNRKGHSLLHVATDKGQKAVFETVIGSLTDEQKYSLLVVKDSEEFTPLHQAVSMGHHSVMKCVHHFVSPSTWYSLLAAQNKTGDNMLHVAYGKGDASIVTFLIESLPKEDAFDMLYTRNANAQTPLHVAVYEGQHELVFFSLAFAGSAERQQELLAKRDNSDNNVLFEATSQGHTDIVEMIIDFICDSSFRLIESTNVDGMIGLHLAASRGHTGTVDSILQSLSHAEIHQLLTPQDKRGNTPIAEAAKHGHIEMLQQMMVKTENTSLVYELLKLQNLKEQTVLHLAAVCGQLQPLGDCLEGIVSPEQWAELLAVEDTEGEAASKVAYTAGDHDEDEERDEIARHGVVHSDEGVVEEEGTSDLSREFMDMQTAAIQQLRSLSLYASQVSDGLMDTSSFSLTSALDCMKGTIYDDRQMMNIGTHQQDAINLRHSEEDDQADDATAPSHLANSDVALDDGELQGNVVPGEKSACIMHYAKTSADIIPTPKYSHTPSSEKISKAEFPPEPLQIQSKKLISFKGSGDSRNADLTDQKPQPLTECAHHEESQLQGSTICDDSDSLPPLEEPISSLNTDQSFNEPQVLVKAPPHQTELQGISSDESESRFSLEEPNSSQNADPPCTKPLLLVKAPSHQTELQFWRLKIPLTESAVHWIYATKSFSLKATGTSVNTDTPANKPQPSTESLAAQSNTAGFSTSKNIFLLETFGKSVITDSSANGLQPLTFSPTEPPEQIEPQADAAEGKETTESLQLVTHPNLQQIDSENTFCDENESPGENEVYIFFPDELNQKIELLCRDLNIDDIQILQDPYSWEKVVVLAPEATSKLTKPLKDLLAENPQFIGFKIKPCDYDGDSETEQLYWQRTLNFDRKTTTTGSATCELIVQAGTRSRKVFVLGPAHMMFCKEANEKFKTHKCDIGKIREEIQEAPPLRTVDIQSNHEVEIQPTPMIAYRYRYRQPLPPNDPKLYTNDCVLFEFDAAKAQDVQKDLSTANFLRSEELRKVATTDQLQVEHMAALKIAVQNYRGQLYHCVNIDRDIGKCKGVHLTFVLTSKDKDGNYHILSNGDSGSIVYFIGEKIDGKERHQPWGMLVELAILPDLERRVYRAVVLNQAFRDIEKDYSLTPGEIQLYRPPNEQTAISTANAMARRGKSTGPVPSKPSATACPSIQPANHTGRVPACEDCPVPQQATSSTSMRVQMSPENTDSYCSD